MASLAPTLFNLEDREDLGGVAQRRLDPAQRSLAVCTREVTTVPIRRGGLFLPERPQDEANQGGPRECRHGLVFQ